MKYKTDFREHTCASGPLNHLSAMVAMDCSGRAQEIALELLTVPRPYNDYEGLIYQCRELGSLGHELTIPIEQGKADKNDLS